jgi:hypothetical protein
MTPAEIAEQRKLAAVTEASAESVLFDEQNGCCAICRRDFQVCGKQIVDHDHETGFIRGLLCRSCNTLERNGSPHRAFENYRDAFVTKLPRALEVQ